MSNPRGLRASPLNAGVGTFFLKKGYFMFFPSFMRQGGFLRNFYIYKSFKGMHMVDDTRNLCAIVDTLDKGPISIKKYTENILYEMEKLGTIKIYKYRLYNYTIKINVFKRILMSNINVIKLFFFCKKNRIKKIFIPNVAGYYIPLVLLLFGKKYEIIGTVHGVARYVVPQYSKYNKKMIFNFFDKYLNIKWYLFIKYCLSKIITVSQSEKNNIVKIFKYSKEKICVIYHGIGDNFCKNYDANVLKNKYGIVEPFILHISTGRPKKNIINILKAFHILKYNYGIDDINLVIGGKLFDKDKYVSHSKKLNIVDSVKFVGYIPEEDLQVFYREAVLFVFPSYHESFGMPILEALACGCPVVTSNLYSMPEIGGDAAIYVNPDDPYDLAEKMYSICTDNILREELSKRAKKRAKLFTWPKAADKHIKCIFD